MDRFFEYYGGVFAWFFLTIAFPVGLIITGFVLKEPPRSGRFKTIGCLVLSVWFVWFGMTAPSLISAAGKAREAETKANLHAIQIALEQYAFDNEKVYPLKVEELIDDYMEEFPANVFTGKEMVDIKFADGPSEGDFTYIPFPVDGESARGYYLIAYGEIFRNTDGMDVDGDGVPDEVILALSSGTEVDSESTQVSTQAQELADLLNRKYGEE